MNLLVFNAATFAEKAHRGQKRKITGADYIVHPGRVATRIATLEYSIGTVSRDEAIAASWLHDVIEDCQVTYETLKELFGEVTASLVLELTDVYTKNNFPLLNRAKRKQKENKRIFTLSYTAKLIKLVDRIDNVTDMPEHFYLKESALLLEVLRGTHKELENELERLIITRENYS